MFLTLLPLHQPVTCWFQIEAMCHMFTRVSIVTFIVLFLIFNLSGLLRLAHLGLQSQLAFLGFEEISRAGLAFWVWIEHTSLSKSNLHNTC